MYIATVHAPNVLWQRTSGSETDSSGNQVCLYALRLAPISLGNTTSSHKKGRKGRCQFMSHSEFWQVPLYTKRFLEHGEQTASSLHSRQEFSCSYNLEIGRFIVSISKPGKLALFRIASKFTKLRCISRREGLQTRRNSLLGSIGHLVTYTHYQYKSCHWHCPQRWRLFS